MISWLDLSNRNLVGLTCQIETWFLTTEVIRGLESGSKWFCNDHMRVFSFESLWVCHKINISVSLVCTPYLHFKNKQNKRRQGMYC